MFIIIHGRYEPLQPLKSGYRMRRIQTPPAPDQESLSKIQEPEHGETNHTQVSSLVVSICGNEGVQTRNNGRMEHRPDSQSYIIGPQRAIPWFATKHKKKTRAQPVGLRGRASLSRASLEEVVFKNTD